MSFSDTLNRYITGLGCSAKALADASGVSPAVISRYRSGDRIPSVDCPQLRGLTEGIVLLSGERLNAADVKRALTQSITGIVVSYDGFLANLNRLLAALSIRSCEIARALSYDASYISRILAGQRRPADLPQFIACVSELIIGRCASCANAALAAGIMGVYPAELLRTGEGTDIVAAWLSGTLAPRRLQPERLHPHGELLSA